jgi:hypothetical protein
MASLECAAARAAASTWWAFRASGGVCPSCTTRRGGRNRAPGTRCCPRHRCDSGCCRCPSRCAGYARRPTLVGRVLAVFLRALSTAAQAWAIAGGGARRVVTFVQRFGSALQLNITSTRWCPASASPATMGELRAPAAHRRRRRVLLHRTATRVRMLRVRWAMTSRTSTPRRSCAASISVALDVGRGRAQRRQRSSRASLHAGVHLHGDRRGSSNCAMGTQRHRAVAPERLPDGRYAYRMKAVRIAARTWCSMEAIAETCPLIPPRLSSPAHGVFAELRLWWCPSHPRAQSGSPAEAANAPHRLYRLDWAAALRQVYGIDVPSVPAAEAGSWCWRSSRSSRRCWRPRPPRLRGPLPLSRRGAPGSGGSDAPSRPRGSARCTLGCDGRGERIC